MRLGCAAYSYRDLLKSGEWTLERFIDNCAELGFDGVELTAYYFSSTLPSYLHEVKRYCFSRGLHVLGTAVGSNFTQVDEAARRQHLDMTREWIDHSVILGAPCLRVFAGPTPKDVSEETAFGWAVECLQECVTYAAERGLSLALENHGGITATSPQVQRLLAAVDSPWLGVNLDFGNFTVDPYAEFQQLAPRTITTHAKPTSRFGAERHEVDYARVRRILDGAGYRGYISIEFEEPVDPRVGVPVFLETLKAAFR